MATIAVTYDCTACGGTSWLPSLPEGQSACGYCKDGKVTEHKPARRALVFAARSRHEVEAYLPSNYKVVRWIDGGPGGWLIEGYDSAGWTLDGYVIPRLASGLMRAEEQVPA